MILGYTLTTFPKSHKTLMHNQSNRDLWHNCKRNKRETMTTRRKQKTPPKCEQKDLAPLNFEGKQCHRPSHHTQVEYQSEIIEHHPLVTQQSLGQSEAFLPLSLGWPQPIRDFPTIEPCTLQHHNTKVI